MSSTSSHFGSTTYEATVVSNTTAPTTINGALYPANYNRQNGITTHSYRADASALKYFDLDI